jgi:nitrite reductase/ring-hydroxylating ferredoxin subunit
MSSPGSGSPSQTPAQPLSGYRSNEEWDQLLEHTQSALDEVQGIADESVRKQVLALLDDVDSIHREALHRLVRLFKEGVLEQVATDPAIHTLLELYDLLPPTAGTDAAPTPAKEVAAVPMKFMRKEQWQAAAQLAAGGPPKAKAAPMPHWLPVPLAVGEPGEGGMAMVQLDDQSILMMRAVGQLYAVDARCSTDQQIMAGATLRHYTLVCPHHAGCFYDIRTGNRLAGGGRVEPMAVRVTEAGAIQLGIGMPYVSPVPIY